MWLALKSSDYNLFGFVYLLFIWCVFCSDCGQKCYFLQIVYFRCVFFRTTVPRPNHVMLVFAVCDSIGRLWGSEQWYFSFTVDVMRFVVNNCCRCTAYFPLLVSLLLLFSFSARMEWCTCACVSARVFLFVLLGINRVSIFQTLTIVNGTCGVIFVFASSQQKQLNLCYVADALMFCINLAYL